MKNESPYEVYDKWLKKINKPPRVRFIFAWYDIWVGAFVDTKKKLIYVFPVPMFGIIISYN